MADAVRDGRHLMNDRAGLPALPWAGLNDAFQYGDVVSFGCPMFGLPAGALFVVTQFYGTEIRMAGLRADLEV